MISRESRVHDVTRGNKEREIFLHASIERHTMAAAAENTAAESSFR